MPRLSHKCKDRQNWFWLTLSVVIDTGWHTSLSLLLTCIFVHVKAACIHYAYIYIWHIQQGAGDFGPY